MNWSRSSGSDVDGSPDHHHEATLAGNLRAWSPDFAKTILCFDSYKSSGIAVTLNYPRVEYLCHARNDHLLRRLRMYSDTINEGGAQEYCRSILEWHLTTVLRPKTYLTRLAYH